MIKKIVVDNNRTLVYSIIEDRPYTFQIREDIKSDDCLEKNYFFNRGKNYEIGGYTIDNDITSLVFVIDSSHPLYIPFIDMLSDDEEIIINDDRINEKNKKYLKIKKNEDQVVLQFINNLTNNKNKFTHDRFNIFIKNIYYDRNSKIDQDNLDTKYRLNKFFIEVNNMMLEEELENNNAKKIVKKRTSTN